MGQSSLRRRLEKDFPVYFENPFEISVNAGWSELIYILFRLKDEYESKEGTRYHVSQVKEKLAELRFYDYSDDDSSTSHYIDIARDVSGVICEQCGAPGWTMKKEHGWLVAVCERHGWKRDKEFEYAFESVCQDSGQTISIPPVSPRYMHLRYAFASRLLWDLRSGDLSEMVFGQPDEADGLLFDVTLKDPSDGRKVRRLDDYVYFLREISKVF